MRALILIAALALSACATPNPIQPAPVQGRTVGIGTLAFGAWEQETAPAYTRLAVLRHRATADLTSGRITKAQAQAIQATADRARDQLAMAVRGSNADPSPAQRAALAEARRITDLGYALLEDR